MECVLRVFVQSYIFLTVFALVLIDEDGSVNVNLLLVR